MALIRDVSFKITGQVKDDYDDNDYEVVKAKLKVICAEYNLQFEEEYE